MTFNPRYERLVDPDDHPPARWHHDANAGAIAGHYSIDLIEPEATRSAEKIPDLRNDDIDGFGKSSRGTFTAGTSHKQNHGAKEGRDRRNGKRRREGRTCNSRHDTVDHDQRPGTE